MGILGVILTGMGMLYYKIGRLEQKINTLYDNISIAMRFKNNGRGGI